MPLRFIRKSYSSLDDYGRHHAHIDASRDLRYICPLDLARQCISLADFCGHKVSTRGISLFVEFINFALAPSSDGFLKCTDDYKYQEPTIKTAITTIVGLASAKYIAEKDWGIPRLLHCKELSNYFQMDNCIYSATHSRFIPDFFGVNPQDIGYLFEAKGSGVPSNSTIGNSRKSTGRIQHAIDDQLGSINGIRTPSKSYVIGKDNRYAVESGFNEHVFMISDIDPSSRGNISMLLNPAEAYIGYYSALLDNRTTSANNSPVRIEGREYVVFPISGTKYSMGALSGLSGAVRELAEAYKPFPKTVSKIIDRYGFRGASMTSSDHLRKSYEKTPLTVTKKLGNDEAISTEITHQVLRKANTDRSLEIARHSNLGSKTLRESLVPVMPADAYSRIEEAYLSTIQKHGLIKEIGQITSDVEPVATKEYSIGPDGFALFKGM